MSTRLPPTWLDGLTLQRSPHIDKNSLDDTECAWQIVSSNGNRKLRIRYRGTVDDSENPPFIYAKSNQVQICALDTTSNEEILIFDNCQHGYESLFCDAQTIENSINVPHIYRDARGNELFEVIATFYHNVDYEDDSEWDAEQQRALSHLGKIKTMRGDLMSLEQLKRDGFDAFRLDLINPHGEKL